MSAAAVAIVLAFAAPHIDVQPAVGLWDARLAITITHLAPGKRAVLHADTTDDRGRPFTSSTRIRADAYGRVTLRGAAAARVLWSMHPPKAGPADYYLYSPPPGGERIRLEVGAAEASFTRTLLAPGERSRVLRPASSGFYGEFFEPKARARHPGILLFGGSEGGLSVRDEAALLAAHGYPTLALAYFAEPGLPRNLLRIPLEYFGTALRWLGRQPGVDPTRLVVAGISRGSEAAQLVGIRYPSLVHAVAAFVPSNAPVCGIPRVTATTAVRCLGPAWTWQGKAIAYTSYASAYATQAIPDEAIDGPVFLDCGGQDALWPSCPMAHAIVTRLRAYHFAHPVTLLDYPNAGHAVGALVPNDPTHLPLGGTIAADQHARADGWPRLLAFLRSL